MAHSIFVSQQLSQRNYPNEIAKAVFSIAMNRIKVTTGNADEFHRHLQVLLHSDSEKVKNLARWW